MALLFESLNRYVHDCLEQAGSLSSSDWIAIIVSGVITSTALIYAFVYIAAPLPRPPRLSETKYKTAEPDGTVVRGERLPCWHDKYVALKNPSNRNATGQNKEDVEDAEVFMSLVIPAYNEEQRLGVMLEEAIDFLNREYLHRHEQHVNGFKPRRRHVDNVEDQSNTGWEILIVSDGSIDGTESVALDFARKYPEGSIRVITLESNRGKGGAVIHGMRHVRGRYVIFADADGASKFDDLRKLLAACQKAEDKWGRAVAVGSRAHLVGSEAVVKRSVLRNFLMHSFHLLLRLLTPPATSRIRDTQCGFKLFSRPSLPYIIPHMHSEGWIFDVEMLMLAENAKIPTVEVAVAWKEVKGSKLNPLKDSIGMAWGLAILRAAWILGVYRV